MLYAFVDVTHIDCFQLELFALTCVVRRVIGDWSINGIWSRRLTTHLTYVYLVWPWYVSLQMILQKHLITNLALALDIRKLKRCLVWLVCQTTVPLLFSILTAIQIVLNFYFPLVFRLVFYNSEELFTLALGRLFCWCNSIGVIIALLLSPLRFWFVNNRWAALRILVSTSINFWSFSILTFKVWKLVRWNWNRHLWNTVSSKTKTYSLQLSPNFYHLNLPFSPNLRALL